MNKKGQEFGAIIVLLMIFAVIYAIMSIPTSHSDCMDDCKRVHKQDYKYETECSWTNFTKFTLTKIESHPEYYPCNKTDTTKLDSYCFDICKEK